MTSRIFTKSNFLVAAILLIGLFFRTYKLEIFYTFNHDQDLYAWIVKDILINHHFRLIGQLTSVEGVFIGSLFYYLLVPFFALFHMEAFSATILTTIIGLLTIFSVYFVATRLFNKTAGFIASFLYSVSIGNAYFDRWVVPTEPTVIWSIWFFYAIFLLLKGEKKSLLILSVLIGLIWHIHIALLPLTLLIPMALFFSWGKIKLKYFFLPILVTLILTTPFWMFEFRHNFQQIHGMVVSLSENRGEATGFVRVTKVLNNASGSLNGNLLNGFNISPILSLIILALVSIFLKFKKIVSSKLLIIVWSWIFLVLLTQSISKRAVSEYYFANLAILPIFLLSIFIASFFKQIKSKILITILLMLSLLMNLSSLFKLPEYQDGYFQKRQLVEYVQQDALSHGYDCVSVNYIAKFGTGVGFRYLLWQKGLKLIKPGLGAPVYNIVIPASVSESEINAKFGILGVILPNQRYITDKSICDDPNNQPDPLLGFSN